MEGESSPHRDPRREHALSLSLINSQTIALADTVVLESGDLGRGMRTASPPSGRADRKGCGGRGGDGCSLSVAPSLQAHFSPSMSAPDPSSHNKQPEASENGHHTAFPTLLRGRSLLPAPVLWKAYTHQEISWTATVSHHRTRPRPRPDTQKLPSDTGSLSFTPLWVQVPTPPPTLRQ